MYKTLVEAIISHAKNNEFSNKTAVAFRSDSINYSQLYRQIKSCAYILSNEYGISSRDRVMLTAVSKIDYVVALLAIQYLGAISIPVEKNAKTDNVISVYEFNKPKLLIFDGDIEIKKRISLSDLYKQSAELSAGDEFDKINLEYISYENEDDVSEMLFTTGTTGIPKGVMLTYKNIYASIHNNQKGVGMRTDDVVLIPLPLNHSVGMRELRTTLYLGATVVIQNGFRFAMELQKNIDQYNCSVLVTVPASIAIVKNQMKERFPEVIGKLRYIEVGAGSLSYSQKKEFVELLPNTTIFNTWGSTETGGAIYLNVTENPDKYASIGKPVDGVEVKIVNPEGQEIVAKDPDSAGKMAIRGDVTTAGYYNLPEENAKTLVDGWLLTNDMVYRDEDGYVYMMGRADSIINVGGKKVSPVEVENIAQEYSEVMEAACIGVEDLDGILGEVPALYVAGKEGLVDIAGLRKHMNNRMEEYKIPKYIIQVDSVPRNRMKKINYAEVKRLWAQNGPNDLNNNILYNILSRRSIRKFQDKAISRPLLEVIVKAGIYAPSGKNMQSWKFTVIQNPEVIKEYKEIVGRVAKEKKVFFFGFNNPAALVLVSNSAKNPNEIQDSACAVENILLTANSFGLGGVWLNPLRTISDEPEIRDMLTSFNIPEDHTVWSTVALGYPDENPDTPERKMDVVEWI